MKLTFSDPIKTTPDVHEKINSDVLASEKQLKIAGGK